MIRITPDISIDPADLQWQFVRASGPGGQHVNKTATAVQLRYDVAASTDLPAEVKRRLGAIAGQKLTDAGELVIDARSSRSQDRNRREAVERLVELLRRAAHKPRPRRKTRPTLSSVRRRLEDKRRRGEKKKLRKKVRRDRG